MPERATAQRANKQLRKGRAPSTAAGEYVREEMHHIREGKHGARSAKQAIAIGLSKARRAGVPLEPPERGKASTKRAARSAYKAGQRHPGKAPSRTRSRATSRALKREPHRAASHRALASQAHTAAKQRPASSRTAAARKAAARKAAATRQRHASA